MINHLLDITELRQRVHNLTRDEVIAEIQEIPLPDEVRADAIIRLVKSEEPPARVLRDVWTAIQRAHSN